MEPLLTLGLPKGSLQDATIDLFHRAGYQIQVSERSYFPSIDDPQIRCIMFRSQEMARYTEDGIVDCGVTGLDWIEETESDVHQVGEMQYSKVSARPARWVLAVPNESDIQTPEDLAGGVIATELVETTRRYFQRKGIDVKVEFSWGATEVKARILNAIVDVTETGASLRANNLRVIDEIMSSTPRFIANNAAWADPERREKIESINLLLQGAIAARSKVGLKLNVPLDKLSYVLTVIGSFGEHSPTISPLTDKEWVALEVILEERAEREAIPKLQQAGASGFVSYPLNKVIS